MAAFGHAILDNRTLLPYLSETIQLCQKLYSYVGFHAYITGWFDPLVCTTTSHLHNNYNHSASKMSPKWTTSEQEEFLEKQYGKYRQVMNQGKQLAYKAFWENLRKEWTEVFGWSVCDVEKKGAPGLERVSICVAI